MAAIESGRIYEVQLEGVTQDRSFNRTGYLVIGPTLDSNTTQNGINSVEILLQSGSPALNFESGAIQFATNSGFHIDAGNAQLDLTFVEQPSENEITVSVDQSISSTGSNLFNSTSSLQSLYQILNGGMALQFSDDGSNVFGVVDIQGTLSLENRTASYTANISGVLIESSDQQIVDDSEPVLSEGDTVYRFFETNGQTQFYTTSEIERDTVINTLPNYVYEGESFIGAPNPEFNDITGVTPVYRFFNTNTGVHLYTASEAERDFVTENLANYTPEGISYYGYESQQQGTVPLYRFYNPGLDAHFYTPSVAERDEFITSSEYQLEGGDSGIAFYVNPVDVAIRNNERFAL